MYEVGLDIRIKQGKVILRYNTIEYEIRSHPNEPCTYICKDGTILHTLHNGFEVEQIEKMILRDKQFKSVTGKMIGYELLRDILASVIDDGRPDVSFDYAEQLGIHRGEKRQATQAHIDELHQKDMMERMTHRANENTKNVENVETPTVKDDGQERKRPIDFNIVEACRKGFLCGESSNEKWNSFSLSQVEMNLTEAIQSGWMVENQRMKKYIYRGETERDFYLAFSKAHDLEEFHLRIGDEEAEKPDKPMGIIIVPKDYENEWIAKLDYYLDWLVMVAPVASQFVKGFSNPHWKVLKDNTNAESSGCKYVIYQNPEGKIVGDTPLTELDIADSLEEYEAMSAEEVESMCYRSEMSRAR